MLNTDDNSRRLRSVACKGCRDTLGQFGDPFEALPTFLPEADANWSDKTVSDQLASLASVVTLAEEVPVGYNLD